MKPKLTLRDLFWLVLVAAVWQSSGRAYAEDAKAPALPDAESHRLLKWLPEDTETVVAARDFTLAPLVANKDETEIDRYNLKPLIFYSASGDLMTFLAEEEEKYARPVSGLKVKLALCGSRNYEAVSAFGSIRCENCAIVVFDNPLGTSGDEWLERVRRGAKQIRKLHGQEVFVFPSHVVSEDFVKPKPWQGTYLAMIAPDTLLCATSDRYLAEVLRRRAAAVSDKRALPDGLVEWKHVDPEAQTWMVRHVPDRTSPLLGLTWSWKDDQMRLVYLPNPAKAGEVQGTLTHWKDYLGPKNVRIIKEEEKVQVTFRTNDVPLTAAFLMANSLGWTQMDDGNQP